MSDFMNYQLATAHKDTARQDRNRATVALELAQIRERLAEIKSQHEPLDSLSRQPLHERDKLYAAAFYVVVGRIPERMEGNE